MKKIIQGIRYDTEKAQLIGSDEALVPPSDFHHWTEALYVAPRSGRYFLAGEGHALTKYGRRAPNGDLHAGEAIVPMTREEALTWAEQHLSAEAVEEHFGDMIEDA
jgi:hypothetical protein